mgnify:CR=1 FL=1
MPDPLPTELKWPQMNNRMAVNGFVKLMRLSLKLGKKVGAQIPSL